MSYAQRVTSSVSKRSHLCITFTPRVIAYLQPVPTVFGQLVSAKGFKKHTSCYAEMGALSSHRGYLRTPTALITKGMVGLLSQVPPILPPNLQIFSF